jgi:hypothetical protein
MLIVPDIKSPSSILLLQVLIGGQNLEWPGLSLLSQAEPREMRFWEDLLRDKSIIHSLRDSQWIKQDIE